MLKICNEHAHDKRQRGLGYGPKYSSLQRARAKAVDRNRRLLESLAKPARQSRNGGGALLMRARHHIETSSASKLRKGLGGFLPLFHLDALSVAPQPAAICSLAGGFSRTEAPYRSERLWAHKIVNRSALYRPHPLSARAMTPRPLSLLSFRCRWEYLATPQNRV